MLHLLSYQLNFIIIHLLHYIQIIPSLLLLLRDYCNTHPTSTAASTNSTVTTNTTKTNTTNTTVNSKSNGSKVGGEEDKGITAVKKYAALTAQRVLKVCCVLLILHMPVLTPAIIICILDCTSTPPSPLLIRPLLILPTSYSLSLIYACP